MKALFDVATSLFRSVFSVTCLCVTVGFGLPAAATDFQLSVFGGLLSAPSSKVSGTDPSGVGGFDFTTGWSAKDTPPSFGIRGTWWTSDTTGYALNFNRQKFSADDASLAASGFSSLEFQDGVDTVTVNAMRRFPTAGRWTPYVGGGIGVAIPHSDIQTSGSGPRTNEYSYGGVVAQFQGGVELELNDSWSLFGEYQMNVLDLDVDLSGGGDLSTGVITNSLSVGAGFSF